MTQELCTLVVEHQKILGGLCADIDHIKTAVENGLSDKLDKTEATLDAFIKKTEVDAAVLYGENWFTRILKGSVAKIISICIVFIVMSALASSGFQAVIKNYYFKETPGQIQSLVKMHLGEGYHDHVLADGRILLHAGNPNQPAWILDPVTKTWERAPDYRGEGSIK